MSGVHPAEPSPVRVHGRVHVGVPAVVPAGGIRRLVVAGLALRALAIPIPVALLQRAHPHAALGGVVAVAALLCAANAAAVALARGWAEDAVARRSNFALDVGLTAAVGLWAATQVPRGTLLAPNSDVFLIYTVGTVVLWTGLRGRLAGALLTAGGLGLQVGMARLNGADLTPANTFELGSRGLWMVIGFVVVTIVASISRQSLATALEEGRRAGRETERARVLRAMHDTVLQTLEAITARLDRVDLPPEDRVAWVRSVASRQSVELRRVLRREAEDPGETYDRFAQLASDFEIRTGVLADFVYVGPEPALAARQEDALFGAAGEALRNTERHANARTVNVLFATGRDRARVVIRDDGCGFNPEEVPVGAYGIAESIVRRLQESGGGATIHSTPGTGTRVELWVPLATAAGAPAAASPRPQRRRRGTRQADAAAHDPGPNETTMRQR